MWWIDFVKCNWQIMRCKMITQMNISVNLWKKWQLLVNIFMKWQYIKEIKLINMLPKYLAKCSSEWHFMVYISWHKCCSLLNWAGILCFSIIICFWVYCACWRCTSGRCVYLCWNFLQLYTISTISHNISC